MEANGLSTLKVLFASPIVRGMDVSVSLDKLVLFLHGNSAVRDVITEQYGTALSVKVVETTVDADEMCQRTPPQSVVLHLDRVFLQWAITAKADYCCAVVFYFCKGDDMRVCEEARELGFRHFVELPDNAPASWTSECERICITVEAALAAYRSRKKLFANATVVQPAAPQDLAVLRENLQPTGCFDVDLHKRQTAVVQTVIPAELETPREGRVGVIVFGGGPGSEEALTNIFARLPDTSPSILVALQEDKEDVLLEIAERLDTISELSVRLASDGDTLQLGTVLICGSANRLEIEAGVDYSIVLQKQACRVGNIDSLFLAAAEHFGRRSVGVFVSGNGGDGVAGMGALQAAGGRTLAQEDRVGSVFALAHAAMEAGCLQDLLPVEHIASHLCHLSGVHTVCERKAS